MTDNTEAEQQTEQEPTDAPKTRTRSNRFVSQPGEMTITYPKQKEPVEEKSEKLGVKSI